MIISKKSNLRSLTLKYSNWSDIVGLGICWFSRCFFSSEKCDKSEPNSSLLFAFASKFKSVEPGTGLHGYHCTSGVEDFCNSWGVKNKNRGSLVCFLCTLAMCCMFPCYTNMPFILPAISFFILFCRENRQVEVWEQISETLGFDNWARRTRERYMRFLSNKEQLDGEESNAPLLRDGTLELHALRTAIGHFGQICRITEPVMKEQTQPRLSSDWLPHLCSPLQE